MSQYYYEDGNLIQDDQVPFVKTISRLSRYSDGSLQEYQLPVEMPGLKGASAEFLPNHLQPHYDSEIIKLNQINEDAILIGYIYGGIVSPTLNPFVNNVTSTTSADPTIYRVNLIRTLPDAVESINGALPLDFNVFPNPFSDKLNIQSAGKDFVSLDLRLFSSSGKEIFSEFYKHSGNITISTDHLPVGIYFLQLKTNGAVQTRKMIKGL